MTAQAPPFLSVVIPSRGGEGRLVPCLDALSGQTFPAHRFEVIVALDGAVASGAAGERIARLGARVAALPERRGPGAARNAGAALARGAYLAFTEDDVVPEPHWLERAASRLEAEPAIDVLVGETVKPGGRPVRIRAAEAPQYLPTNLFVRSDLFRSVGGYCERFFDARRGIYFREDSDLGFTLEEEGATIVHEPAARVTHPEEHPDAFDPLRWARRYEMDPLLQARHPRLFRERIEAHRVGPFVFRRPVVRGSVAYAFSLLALLASWTTGQHRVVLPLAALAFAGLLPVWGKWRFHPARLPAALLVPFVLLASYAAGWLRVRRKPEGGADGPGP